MSQDLLRVCRIGRAQGLKGEVNVMVTTDDPERRFAPGAVLLTRDGKQMTVASSRRFKQRWIIRFEGVNDRNASEALKGIELFVEPDHAIGRADDDGRGVEAGVAGPGSEANGRGDGAEFSNVQPDGALSDNADFDEYDAEDAEDVDGEDDGFYAEELMNLKVRIPRDTADPEGEYDEGGLVIDVTESPAQWLLTVREPSGAESLVPFVDAFIPVIDVEEGYLVLTPPNGLLQDR